MLSTFDRKGGAAIAVSRLHQGLQQQGVNSTMLVREKLSEDPTVIGPAGKLQQGWAKTRGVIDALPLQLYRRRDRGVTFFPQWLPNRFDRQVEPLAPDILNLHWVSGGFVPIEALAQFQRPLVWTLHDMWPLTGGCHYSHGCDRYQKACGRCPQLDSHTDWDLSRWVWRRKANAWKAVNLTLVCPSHWLADVARRSSLFHPVPIEVIANGLDLDQFRPIPQRTARELLRLPLDVPLILCGASALDNPTKGLDLFQTAMQRLRADLSLRSPSAAAEVVLFGPCGDQINLDLGCVVHALGPLQDTISLVLTYAAANVMVVPSRYEAFGQTASEALACGIPVVAFDATGLKDIVDHQQNGYLAQPYNDQDLAKGIAWVLDHPQPAALRQTARAKAEQYFSHTKQANHYRQLFEQCLSLG
ncbi:MAG: glycosyltransferase family 4 protein [Cyanobacteria bacterium J06639_16]